ncbi:DUF3617 domain-containing protein [Massilia horti]|uniref:DUF3617 domain-containing protein n=1 Tax=Massilia horti TaxID=2562153 RepID=A0A4Y9T064_9BURK|nr:DUF3617 domain-containing protein [Massilia horti]TFW30283.1 DUF3617 domain-containing protein [Massilia horti]
MQIRTCALAALVLGSLALPASAQHVKPGLWEMTTSISSADGQMQAAMAEMQKQMATMSPEQRKMMDQMLAKQGVQFGPSGDGGMRVKVCVTKEMAAQNELPIQRDGDCTQRRSPLAGGTMKVSFTCTNPRVEGDGEIMLAGDNSYRARMKWTSYDGGKPVTSNGDVAGKWLGSDCGNIKPLESKGK